MKPARKPTRRESARRVADWNRKFSIGAQVIVHRGVVLGSEFSSSTVTTSRAFVSWSGLPVVSVETPNLLIRLDDLDPVVSAKT